MLGLAVLQSHQRAPSQRFLTVLEPEVTFANIGLAYCRPQRLPAFEGMCFHLWFNHTLDQWGYGRKARYLSTIEVQNPTIDIGKAVFGWIGRVLHGA